MKNRWSRWTLALALVGSVTFAACGDEGSEQDGPTRLTARVTRGNLIIRAEATGNVEPVRKVEVKSKASGEILRLHIDVGDQVERGALLAEIDPRDVQNNYNQVQADLEVARARLEISDAQLERSRQLLAAGVITPQEHENARLDYTNSQASLVRAETNYNLAQLQMNDVSIRAPMDGTIIQKNVEEGMVIQSASQNVSGGTALFLMADLGEMQVRTLVDETDMGMLSAGMTATISVEAYPDRNFQGAIQKIEPQATVEQNVTMFPVIVTLDNSSGLLRPGMNAEVEIFIDEARDVLIVPNNAVVRAEDVGPAAMALGLNVDDLDMTVFTQAGGGQSGGAAGAGAASAEMMALRQQLESGQISQDSMRAMAQAMRAQGGFGGQGGQGFAGRGSGRGGRFNGGGEDAAGRETRPGAVFALMPDGSIEPRAIQIGLGDWDNTQVTGDVQEGDLLVIVGAAQLQAQQEEWLNRMRDRMGGGSPFGGGVPGGGRGFPGGGGGGRRGY